MEIAYTHADRCFNGARPIPDSRVHVAHNGVSLVPLLSSPAAWLMALVGFENTSGKMRSISCSSCGFLAMSFPELSAHSTWH